MRLALHDVVVLAGLAEVDGQRHDLGLVLVLDPLEHHARVQAAGVQQQDAVDLAGLGEVGGGAGVRACGSARPWAAEGYRRPLVRPRAGPN